jgi:hypothetical protein
MSYLDLKGIYKGFVRSYASFCLPSDFDNISQTTPTVLAYFANLGKMLGYLPYFEYRRMDLSWYDWEENLILHLEHENNISKAEETVDKLLRTVDRKLPLNLIGIMWAKSEKHAHQILKHVQNYQKKGHYKKEHQLLLIIKINKGNEDKNQSIWYPVQGCILNLKNNQPVRLDEARLFFPQIGWQNMWFSKEEW